MQIQIVNSEDMGKCPDLVSRFTPVHAPPSKMNGIHAGNMYVFPEINNYSIKNTIFNEKFVTKM